MEYERNGYYLGLNVIEFWFLKYILKYILAQGYSERLFLLFSLIRDMAEDIYIEETEHSLKSYLMEIAEKGFTKEK